MLSLVVSLVLRRIARAPGARQLTQEAGLVLSLFAVWQLAGRLDRAHTDRAYDRAREVWQLQRSLHLPSELWMQSLVLPHGWLVQLLNGYYLYGHLNVMVVTLLWLFLRRREAYPPVRNALAITSAFCLGVHLVFPLAPPRLLPELGFVDTAMRYGQSVYGPLDGGLANQFSAMPSLHEAWAVLVAVAVVRGARSRWRWLVVLHPVAMLVDIAVTANHWLLDGIVAAAIVAVVVLLVPDPARRRAPSAQARRVLAEADQVAG